MRYISAETGSFRQYGTAQEVVKMFKEAGFTAYDATLCPNCGFDFIMDADDWQEKAKEFRAYADSIGMPCNQSHAPFATAKKGNEEYNKEMYPKVVRAIEVSGILGAKVCVVHPCNDYTAEENAVLYKSFEDAARKAGVKIGVENMWNWTPGSPTATPAACSHHDDFKKHLDLLSSDVFVACVDIGHAEMAGLDTSAAKMIETLGDYVQSMHLHDVDGIRDNHQIPFTQSIDFKSVIQALRNIRYQGDITLETAYSGVKAPKELNKPLAYYLAAVANYFKEQVEKE
jgi:sugar phosphate isomerase/epimerase